MLEKFILKKIQKLKNVIFKANFKSIMIKRTLWGTWDLPAYQSMCQRGLCAKGPSNHQVRTLNWRETWRSTLSVEGVMHKCCRGTIHWSSVERREAQRRFAAKNDKNFESLDGQNLVKCDNKYDARSSTQFLGKIGTRRVNLLSPYLDGTAGSFTFSHLEKSIFR